MSASAYILACTAASANSLAVIPSDAPYSASIESF
jgi:hypothetical protein